MIYDILSLVVFVNYITLVNKDNLIKDRYFKNLELVDYTDVLGNKIQIEKNTLKAYLELKEFLEMKNIHISINSAYRAFEEQQKIVDEYTIKYLIVFNCVVPYLRLLIEK